MLVAQKECRRDSTAVMSPETFVVGARKSRIGWVAALWRSAAGGDDSLAGVTIGHPTPAAAIAYLAQNAADANLGDDLNDEQERLLTRLCQHADGRIDTFADVHLNFDHLGPFAKKVVQRCRRIPAGQTRTYAQLAAESGSPKAARAVGNVMASNRFPLLVPCHRVVGSGGGLGGFSAPQGIELKRQLLRREGVEV